MNKDKVYIEGYEIDTKVSSLGYREKKIQLMNGKIVIIDENFTHKSIEPQKVKVPQVVEDWLSNLKSGLFGLNYDSVSSEIYDWVYDTEDNIRKLHLAFVYGYEVEKEKQYLVKMPKANFNGNIQILSFKNNSFFWSSNWKGYKTHHTRKELEEADFGWVFDCEGIEVEEVE